ncbi:alpha/beta hydrolase [Salinibacterium sp. dk2585]|uniref:alpha/beta hydrolase n=1 Tax=unclassified Salinibacterium TaxID=2632331 RepID=UPI0011C24DD9|nr:MULTISPECIES: alpha/beta hydrolase [unclassified Salinibacterium]QEE61371.1 alpha/beta hydrolase [Salinibacterium sp. dk2585]TXK54048.1 alpha/beta hydrolase [Salinibacterium sp. dk5596]
MPSKRRLRLSPVRTGGIVAGAVLLAVLLVTAATPWPSAMLIRWVFGMGAERNVDIMQQFAPTEVSSEIDVQPAVHDEALAFDLFLPDDGSDALLPTVVWVHGGAWISGSKSDVAPYLQILASEGYAAVGLAYEYGPEVTYSAAVHQLNAALAELVERSDELRIDPDRIVLAGDSAGAQLASQLATLTVNDSYANLLGLAPALKAGQLVGVVLNCGVYDLRAMAELSGITAWGFKTALWAYTGTRDWSSTSAGATMSTVNFVTEDFPATFITGGNGDGLTWLQSVPMHHALQDKDVDVTALFWAAEHEPALPHEYQFQLDRPEAQEALAQTLGFLERVTEAPSR